MRRTYADEIASPLTQEKMWTNSFRTLGLAREGPFPPQALFVRDRSSFTDVYFFFLVYPIHVHQHFLAPKKKNAAVTLITPMPRDTLYSKELRTSTCVLKHIHTLEDYCDGDEFCEHQALAALRGSCAIEPDGDSGDPMHRIHARTPRHPHDATVLSKKRQADIERTVYGGLRPAILPAQSPPLYCNVMYCAFGPSG